MHGFEQAPIDGLAFDPGGAFDLQALDQAIDAAGEFASTALARVGREPLGKVPGVGNGLQALAEFAHAADLAGAPR